MSEEPRRSGRATKGQHKNASSSPAPNPKSKAASSKRSKKAAAASQPVSEAEDEDETVRCICGNDDPDDKRPFIGCDACSVWQHNVCMGMHDDDDEVPEHYFCEQCRPEEHQETLEALERGEKIWETRNKIYLNEKKMSKKRKGDRGAKNKKPGWLKKDLSVDAPDATPQPVPESLETGNKRKRDDKEEEEAEIEAPVQPTEHQPEIAQQPQPEVKSEVVEKPVKVARQEKRRKSSAPESKDSADPETAVVPIEKLPQERQKIAGALRDIIADDIQQRTKAGSYRIPDGDTARSVGERLGVLIEYEIGMNHNGSGSQQYGAQFRAVLANLKKNKMLIEKLLSKALSPADLSKMTSAEMASDELLKERATLQAQLDRQSTIEQRDDGPRYRRTHKGDELVENEDSLTSTAPVSRPVRHSVDAEMADSPTAASPPSGPGPLTVDTKRSSDAGELRRSSTQNFNVNDIWAKTAQSPTQVSGHRPSISGHRQSSLQVNQQEAGAKDDPDVDRMLADNDDDTYSPAEYNGSDGVVWRGKLVQSSGDSAPTVNARFIAGRDVAQTIAWHDLLPEKLNIDGRLVVAKAEDYLCGLQWSSSSDVSVLSLSAYDNRDDFDAFFTYFKSRGRYAVVNKDRPAMVKDLYIIPLGIGDELPAHLGMLEHCTIKTPTEERLLLATFVVARPVIERSESFQLQQTPVPATSEHSQQIGDGMAQPANGHLPAHMRQQGGPAGSPLQPSGPNFSPSAYNGAPMNPVTRNPDQGAPSPFPPNPYSVGPSGQSPPAPAPTFPPPPPAPAPFTPSDLALEVLGGLAHCPTAQQILSADQQITRDKLEHLHVILERDPIARTDMAVLYSQIV